MTATTGGLGTTWRAAARSMPTVPAAVFAGLLLLSVAVMALALAAGWLSEFTERLAVAGWTAARAIHRAYPPAPTSPPPPPAADGPGTSVHDPAAEVSPDLRRADR